MVGFWLNSTNQSNLKASTTYVQSVKSEPSRIQTFSLNSITISKNESLFHVCTQVRIKHIFNSFYTSRILAFQKIPYVDILRVDRVAS